MKRLFNYIFLFSIVNLNAQTELKTDTIGIDMYDAVYTVKNNTFFKELDGKTKSYQNFNFGSISSIDILNPMEIVIFYKNFNAALILDNELNLKQTITFANNILFARKGITNKIWIYNEDENKVQLYDYKSKTVSISSQVLTDFSPINMESDFNSVQLISLEKTFVFNQYLYLKDTIIH